MLAEGPLRIPAEVHFVFLKGEKATPASGLYALGVILYELASGRKPFSSDVPVGERMTRRPPALKHRWNHALQRCLDPHPSRRFASAADLAKAEGNSGLADSILSQAERYRANLPMRDYRFRSTR